MEPGEVWGERWLNATLPMAKRFMTVAAEKQSLVCLAADPDIRRHARMAAGGRHANPWQGQHR